MGKAKSKPIAVTGGICTFASVMEEMQTRAAAEEAKVAAMTPAQRAEYAKLKAQDAVGTEKILKQLRGPGFIELRVGPKHARK